jgi:hypothetical protein
LEILIDPLWRADVYHDITAMLAMARRGPEPSTTDNFKSTLAHQAALTIREGLAKRDPANTQ